MRALPATLCAAVILVLPASVQAWGLDVHRWLTGRALEGLPPALKPFFDEQREFISEHAADPDLWRVVGLRSDLGSEDRNHFLDIDDLDEPPPFRRVPRTWRAFVDRYGERRAERAGRLPWRVEEIYGRLVSTLRELARPNGSTDAPDSARYLAAVLSHYLEDAHQPLHATANYDGQQTGQPGVHARFETRLVLTERDALHLAPVSIHSIGDMREFAFERIIRSQARVGAVLQADRQAARGRDGYDAAYYAAFFAAVRPALEASLSEASSAVASALVHAWEEAGRPRLPLETGDRPSARIRR